MPTRELVFGSTNASDKPASQEQQTIPYGTVYTKRDCLSTKDDLQMIRRVKTFILTRTFNQRNHPSFGNLYQMKDKAAWNCRSSPPPPMPLGIIYNSQVCLVIETKCTAGGIWGQGRWWMRKIHALAEAALLFIRGRRSEPGVAKVFAVAERGTDYKILKLYHWRQRKL